jgi:hypothetical protein
MASRTLDLVLQLQDNASKKLDGAFKNWESGAKRAGAAFAVVGGALAGAAALSIKAFQEAEVAGARLDQIAKQVTGSTTEEISAMKALADQIQKVGVAEGDAIVAGQSQIASFAKQSSTVLELSDDLADLAVAQYGTNISQEQMIQTGNLLGKALQGQLGALTKTGVLVNDEFKAAFEAANNEQERAVVLSKIIQDNYGGLNKALLNTSEGGLQALKNQFGDLVETIGSVLVPFLSQLVTAVVPIVTKIQEWATANPELFGTITKVVAVLGALMLVLAPILLVLPGIVSAFGILSAVIGAVTLPVLAVIAAIAALIAVGWLIVQNWDAIQAKAMEVWGFISATITTTLEALSQKITAIWEGIKAFFSAVWSGIMFIFKFWIALIAGIVIALFDKMGIDIVAVFTVIKDFMIAFWETFKTLFGEGLLAISEMWMALWTSVGDWFTVLWAGIQEKISIGLAWLVGAFKKYTEPVRAAWTAFWTAMGEPVKQVWDGIKIYITEAINWMITKINTVIKAANKLAQSGAGALGISIPNIPEIPMLAKGGIVTKPTLAMIGEAGPEAVIPLSKMNGGGAGGTVVNIVVNGDISGKDLIDKVSQGIMNSLRLNQRLPI